MIAIIGAGPAGLMAAETLARAGCAVRVYDQKPSPARKFLMAGRGGLNITHSEDLPRFLSRYRAAEDFLAGPVRDFTPAAMRQWCHDLGQETFIGSSGRVFPKAMKASPLLRAWIQSLSRSGVTIETSHVWRGWDENGALIFATQNGVVKNVRAQAVILAMGGASWPGLGSDGAWVEILRARDVRVSDFEPSNCGFTIAWSDYFKTKFAGAPLKNIALGIDRKSARGEAVIAERGLEGGAVYALSAPIRERIAANGVATIYIDLKPEISVAALSEKLGKRRGRASFSTWAQKTAGLAPVHIALLYEAVPAPQNLDALTLAQLVKSVPFRLDAPFPIDRAISSAGGIAREALDSHFMIKTLPGVFAAGEMIDWDAPTGGYLLQASFATGRAAAKGALRWLDEARK